MCSFVYRYQCFEGTLVPVYQTRERRILKGSNLNFSAFLVVAVYCGCVFRRRSQNVVLFVTFMDERDDCPIKCMFFSYEREHLVP